MKIDKKILAIIIAIILILLYFFVFSEEETTPTQTIPADGTAVASSTQSDSKGKLRADVGVQIVTIPLSELFSDEGCCNTFVTATFTYTWDYFPGEDVGLCDQPILWEVWDSTYSTQGVSGIKYDSEEYRPTTKTVTFRGFWDCSHPWTVTVDNYCNSSISYDWELTVVCED